MNRRQRIKRFKQEILKYGYPDKKVKLYCSECESKLSFKDEYHKRYLLCNESCFMRSVGFSWSDFL